MSAYTTLVIVLLILPTCFVLCNGIECHCERCVEWESGYTGNDHIWCTWDGWNYWVAWNGCSRTCGGGVRSRYRTCPCSDAETVTASCSTFCLNSGTLDDVCNCSDEYFGFCCESGMLLSKYYK